MTEYGVRFTEDLQDLQTRAEELERQLFQAQEQLEVLEASRQIALDIASHLELPQLLKTIVQRADRLIDATGGVVYLRPSEEHLFIEAVVSNNLPQDLQGTRLNLGEGVSGRVVQSGEPLVIPDYRHWPHQPPQLSDLPFRSILAVPLAWGGHTHGALEIIDLGGERTFGEKDLDLLMPLAQQAAVAVENALLYEEERRQRKTANALCQAAEIIGHSLDLNQVLDLLLDQLEKLVPYDSSSIQLLEDRSLRVIATRGFPSDMERQPLRWRDDNNEIWQTLVRYKRPLIISDVHNDPRWETSPGLEHVRSWIGVPITTRDWLWGVLTLDKAEPGFYGQRAADLAATVARYAAAAIENAQLYASSHHLGQAHQTRAAQLASLQATSLRLSSTFDLENVLCALAEGALALTPADDTHIYFYDAETDQLAFGTAFWRDGRREPAVDAPRADGLTATVARRGTQVIIENARQHPLFSGRDAGEWGVHAVAGFPLKRHQRVIGVFTVTYLSPHSFNHDEIRILNLLADQATVAIENAQFYQQIHAHSEKLEAQVVTRTMQWREEKERAEVILAHAADGIMLTNAQAVIEYVNPSWERLTGYTAEQALGRKPNILKSGQTPSDTYAEMWQTITDGEVWRGHVRNRRVDGTLHDVDLTIAPVINEDGKIVNFVGVHRDITAMKEVERLKDQFISNVSHELRTPIANLKLYQSLLQRGRPEKHEDYLNVIARETVRLEHLVTDLLDLSRLDRGAITLTPEWVNLNGLAADVVNSFLKLAQERQIALELIQAPDLPAAWLDLRQMTQVLTNLVANALNYTPAGGQVVVETGQGVCRGQPGVEFSVQDTGIGISSTDQKRIFERFFRAQTAREKGVPGTGLGLAISKQIVELHSGQITVHSQLQKGSTFTVCLPIRQEA